MGRLALLSLLLVVVSPGLAAAAQLYQWRDASGVLHYTDNPDAVPAKYRNQSQIEVSPLKGIGSAPSTQGGNVYGSPGEKIWDTKCKACHVYNSDVKNQGLTRGLFSVIINPDTKFPYPEDRIVEAIRKAVDGGYEEMPGIAITDKQLKDLTKFLVDAASNS